MSDADAFRDPGALGLVRGRSPLSDYGRVHQGESGYWIHELEDAAGLARVVQHANRELIPVRARGAGHSMNGSSIPRSGEIVVATESCRHFRFERDSTVTVGAGARVWDLDGCVGRHGFELLVRNDGGASAATVGGFASAGGIGDRSLGSGGFWATVDEILLVTGGGHVVRAGPGDPLWPWIFGSMGQLGVIVEATLRIRRRGDAREAEYPLGVSGLVETTPPAWEHFLWLTLFVPIEQAGRARRQLADVVDAHRDVWVPHADYLYGLPFRGFNPPLIYPRQESFVALGAWGVLPDRESMDPARLRSLEAAFSALVDSEPSYRRYIQTELTFDHGAVRQYFGRDVLDAFLEHKTRCDPRSILGDLLGGARAG